MADGTVFPAFLKLEYQPSGSAKSSFLAEMASISGDAKRQFERSFDEISSVIKKSLSGFKGGEFAIDLDTSSLRRAASEADYAAKQLAVLRDAARSLAAANEDTSAQTQRYLQSLSAQTIEAERAARAAQEQVTTYSRLQGEIDRTIGKNTALADSYRAIYAEQAKAENYATAFQQAINQRFAPRLNDFGAPKSARDSASVFETQSYASKADTRSGLDRLLAGQASIDKAALSGATLEQVLGRVSSKGREVAAALKEAEDAAAALAAQQQKEFNANLAKAAADAKAYAASAAQLRAQLDPSIAIQQKFDAELARADELLAAGAISQREYGLAVAFARDRLNESWQAITRNTEAAKALVTAKPVPAGPGPQTTLSGADALVAGRASIDRAALSGVTLEQVLGRVSTKGREVAAALKAAEDAAAALAAQQQKDLDANLAKAAAEAKEFAAAANLLRTQLDPALAIQQRFDAELANADRLLAAGAISQKEYAQATALARNNLAESWSALTRTQEENERVTKRGTSETSKVINGIRAQRVAFTQLGQQLQDVVVQTQMGTNATTIFVQQVPQMAFALSGLAESTNKTYSRIGQFASFLAGPWGAAIFAGTAVLAPFILSLFNSGEEAKKAKEKHLDLISVLEDSKSSYEEVAQAAAEYANAQTKANQTTIYAIQLEAQAIAARLKGAIAIRQELAAKLDAARVSESANAGQGSVPGAGAFLAGVQQANITAQAQANEAAIGRLSEAATSVGVKVADAVAKINADPAAKIRAGFDELRRKAKDAGLSVSDLTARLTDLNRQESTALDALKKTGKKDKSSDRESKAAAREAEQLARFGDAAAESIQRINERFDEQPRLVDQAAQATRQLDDIIKDLEKRKPSGFEQMIADAERAKGVIEDALVRPFEDLARDSERRMQVQDLLSQGREAEAAAVQEIWRLEQQLGPLTAERLADVRDIAQAEQDHIEKLRVAQEIQAAYLDATRGVRSEVEAILGGYGKLSNLRNVFRQLQGRILAEQLFGDVFRDLDKWVKEKTGIGSSVDAMAKQANRAGDVLGRFADKVTQAIQKIDGTAETAAIGDVSVTTGGSPWSNAKFGVPPLLSRPGAGPASNDNEPIVVVANKTGKATVNDMTPERYFEQLAARLTKPIVDALEKIVGPGFAKTLGGPIAGALEGYLTTGTGFGAVLGGLKDLKGLPESLSKGLGKAFEGAQTGAKIAGIGNALGLGLSDTGSQIGGAIGSLIPIPGADTFGSIAGGFIGKLFGKRPRGGGSVTQDSLNVHANDDGITSALRSFGTDLQSAISKIASALGGQVGSYNVGIGRYKDYYQVSGVGNDPRLGNSYFGRDSANALYDGKDPEAAMRAAILNALQDGAVKGIREGSKRLLSAGKDLEAQIQKAVDFENVFKELKRYTDPVGAALDEVNTKFANLKNVFVEAGATAAELADLEKLYGIERAKAIKDANEQVIGSLRDLYDQLTVGNNALSLRDRKAAALSEYNPLADRVRAGDTTAYADYAKAAQQLLEIERQMSGSQSEYFALQDEVTALLKSRIDAAQNASDTATNRDNPFSKSSTAAANDNASMAIALDALGNRLIDGLGFKLDAVNQNLGTLIQRAAGRGGIVPDYSKIFASGGSW